MLLRRGVKLLVNAFYLTLHTVIDTRFFRMVPNYFWADAGNNNFCNFTS